MRPLTRRRVLGLLGALPFLGLIPAVAEARATPTARNPHGDTLADFGFDDPRVIVVHCTVRPVFPLRYLDTEIIVKAGPVRPFNRSPAYRLARHHKRLARRVSGVVQS